LIKSYFLKSKIKDQTTIYHNPNCTKSRRNLELLKSKEIEPKVVEYLKFPYTKEQLKDILKKWDKEKRVISSLP